VSPRKAFSLFGESLYEPWRAGATGRDAVGVEEKKEQV